MERLALFTGHLAATGPDVLSARTHERTGRVGPELRALISRTREWTVVAGLILGLFVVPIGAETRTAEPFVPAAPARYAFGKVFAGEPVRHEFILHNPGPGQVQIQDVRTNCECTRVERFDRVIAPGRTGSIHIEIDTLELLGKVSKLITLQTDRPFVSGPLVMSGEVLPSIEVRPASLELGRITSLTRLRQDPWVEIIDHHPEPLELSEISCSLEGFGPQLEVVQPGRRWRVRCAPPPDLPAGNYQGFVRLHASQPPYQIVLPISGYVPEQVETRPQVLLVPASAGAQGWERSVLIENSGPVPLELKVLTNATGTQAELKVLQAGQRYRLIVRSSPGTRQRGGASLRLRTNLPTQPEIEIPIVVQEP